MKIYGCVEKSKNAGPSPYDNERLEVFLAGCSMAMKGKPCNGCFNSELWDASNIEQQSIKEVYENIKKICGERKCVTFVGGEPLDQVDELKQLCDQLHKEDFHIIIITHHLFEDIRKKKLNNMADIWIDGKYNQDLHIYNEGQKDNIHNVIGSSNQRIVIKNDSSWTIIELGYLREFYCEDGEYKYR